MRRFGMLVLGVLSILLTMNGCSDDDNAITGPVGWAIGSRQNNTAAILHTRNGGKTCEEQGNTGLWTGLSGNDVSAVDEWTAWAAVGGNDGGAILHASDGGFNWDLQPLPEGVTCFDENTAWVVGFKAYGVSPELPEGVIFHTTDGGMSQTNQPMSANDVALWKVSFVGAHR